jgi:hypothetical protein
MQFYAPLIALCALLHGQVVAQNPPPGAGIKRGRITLPAKLNKELSGRPRVSLRNDPDQFYRDVIDLRRSKQLTAKDEEQLLRRLQENHSDPAGMSVQLALKCRNDLVHGLMKVVDRYGSKYHAEELHFQVLSRPLGRVTARVIKTITSKSGASAKEKLFDYLVCKHAPARKAAVDLLPGYLAVGDTARLIQLSRHQKNDIQRKVMVLLSRVVDPRVHKRLIEILEQESVVAGDACLAIIAQGAPMVAPLSDILRRPARGKAFGYACFALYRLEDALDRELFTEDMVASMVSELRDEDDFLRAAVGIGVGSIAYRQNNWLGNGQHDIAIVESLLTVAAPERFVVNMRLLKPAATEVLINFTGQNFKGRSEAWRSWWAVAYQGFAGLRRTLSVTDDNVDQVMLSWNAAEHFLVFRGPKVPDNQLPQGVGSFFLSADQMMKLIRDLQGLGFMSASELPMTPKTWKVDMRLGDSRVLMRLAPGQDRKSAAGQMHATFTKVARAEVWQKHGDPATAADPLAFWRAERQWLADNPDKSKHRLVDKIVDRLPTLKPAERKEALDDLQSIDGLPNLITDIHGSALVRVARAQAELDASDFRLLEFAVLASGETVWRQALAALDGRVAGAGNDFAARLFRLLGPDRALMAIKHPSKGIAMAAMHDAAATKHRAAEEALLSRMKDPDADVQRTAIYALGVLRVMQARRPLLLYEKTAAPLIRREIWVALGRIGGKEVVPVLKRAMENPDLSDRLAVLSAMGETKSVDIARFLAARYMNQEASSGPLSQRAESSLRRMGPLLAVPALRQYLKLRAGPVRQQLVLFLAEQQDPSVVSDLIAYLRNPKLESLATERLAEITGVDLSAVNNRSQSMRVWQTYNKDKTQGQWYLSALKLAQIPTSLKLEQLTPRVGIDAVAELTRLLLVVKGQHMRALTAVLLRETTGVDYARGVRFAKESGLDAIADRYKFHAETVRAVGK